jgi:exosome complex component RRP40
MPPAAPLSPLVGSVVLPGDSVLSLADVAAAGGAGGTPAVRLGPSLLQSGGEVRAIRAGTLRQTGGGKLWLETSHKRYLPSAEDAVVGVVVERHAEVRSRHTQRVFPQTCAALTAAANAMQSVQASKPQLGGTAPGAGTCASRMRNGGNLSVARCANARPEPTQPRSPRRAAERGNAQHGSTRLRGGAQRSLAARRQRRFAERPVAALRAARVRRSHREARTRAAS